MAEIDSPNAPVHTPEQDNQLISPDATNDAEHEDLGQSDVGRVATRLTEYFDR